jgi:hypothetical protein
MPRNDGGWAAKEQIASFFAMTGLGCKRADCFVSRNDVRLGCKRADCFILRNDGGWATEGGQMATFLAMT